MAQDQAKACLKLLSDDAAEYISGMSSGEEYPLLSLSQRLDKSASELADEFSMEDVQNDWEQEYTRGDNPNKLQPYRRQAAFFGAMRKELKEEYGLKSDVSRMGFCKLPYTQSADVLKLMVLAVEEGD